MGGVMTDQAMRHMRRAGLAAALIWLAAAVPATPAFAQAQKEEEQTPPPPPPRSLIKRIQEQQRQAAAAADAAAKAEAATIADPANTLYLDLSTGGRVTIQLRPDKAPRSVERIKALARRHFYDGLIFHRVIEGFMAQTGDPKGDGSGGSDLPDLKAEFNDMPHVRGEVSMARAESVDSANSQFFIMLAPVLTLDGKYSPVGRVTSGMAYVDAIERGEPPATPSKIVHASLASDGAPAPAASAAPASGAAAAAATAATSQASDAKVAADEARAAAARGDPATAAERAGAAKVAAQGAAQAAGDAAQAAGQAADTAAQNQALQEGGFGRKRPPR